MECVGDNAQCPIFPQRTASLRLWASRETLKMSGTTNNEVKSHSATEAAFNSSVHHYHAFAYISSPNSQQQSELKSATRKEPHMRVRTDGKLILPAWPLLKSSSPRTDRATTTGIMTSSEEPSPKTKLSSFGLRNMLPGASWNGKKRDAVQTRRKASASDIGSSPMTTVQEMSLDSRRCW